MKVGVEEDLFDVIFFPCRGFAVCDAVGEGLGLIIVGFNVSCLSWGVFRHRLNLFCYSVVLAALPAMVMAFS
jgi:hypothetical protein